jgi:hypothetical protein
MAKTATWEDEISKLIASLSDNKVGDNKTGEEAAIVGGGVAGAYRAQQMANAKAANLARPSGTAAPASSALTTTGTTGGGGLATTGSNGLATRPNSSVIKTEGQRPFAEPSQMRNVTPRSGAGIGSVLSGGAVLNPVVAGLAATAAMTGEAGKGSEVVKEGSIQDIIANPAKYAAKAEAPASPAKPKPFTGPTEELVMQGLAPASQAAPEQRSPMERQMVAPKATVVAEEPEPVDANRAAALFAKTHGTPFDPKSSMDRKKMAVVTSLLAKKGSEKLTPNQFALEIYRTTK